MSHVVVVRSEVKDIGAIQAACRRLNLSMPIEGEAKLFSGQVSGVIVELPSWVYPVVCDIRSGRIYLDNFNGRWGNPVHLDRFLQAYSVEKCRLEARKRGHTIAEQQLSDGSIKVTIEVGGGDAA